MPNELHWPPNIEEVIIDMPQPVIEFLTQVVHGNRPVQKPGVRF